MLKYLNAEVTFAEIPDEITLCINITGCPCRCPGCHSQFLWEDTGKPLEMEAIIDLIASNKGISCLCFMGGDNDTKKIDELAESIKSLYYDIKVAWYSGKQEISPDIHKEYFDYIKVGSYIEELGGLDKPTTNQKLFKVYGESNLELVDITYKFQKK